MPVPAGLTAALSFAAVVFLRFSLSSAEVLTLPEGHLAWSFGESWSVGTLVPIFCPASYCNTYTVVFISLGCADAP